MTLVVDTSFVVGLMGARDDRHAAALAWFSTVDEDLVTSPLAVAEMDRLIAAVGGARARDALWSNLGTGTITVRWWADALPESLALARQHGLSLTDASLAAVAARVGTTRIATFDENFRSITTAGGEPFRILPDDA